MDRAILAEVPIRKARNNHLDFIRYTWRKREPLIVGFHTSRICAAIDRAIERYRNGESSNILINVHHRSGKSDIVSRYLGPHFLGEFPDNEVLQVSHESSLAEGFSSFGRNVVRSPKYRRLYPEVRLSTETNRKDDWVLVDEKGAPTGGRLFAKGLRAGLTGNGYHLGILDDYCRGRADAESEAYRNSSWEAFTDDFLTRAAPVSITIVLATQWHDDDISGRIKKAMAEDPDFPRFEILTFPARSSDYVGEEDYGQEYLFEERLGKEWYVKQYATLGPYSSSALLDCNPTPRTGGRFDLSSIDYVIETPGETAVRWVRVWDLAHTAKQRAGDNPDWTSGTLMAFQRVKDDPVYHLWVKDVVRTRSGAAERDAIIKATALKDGPGVRQGIENTIDSKDAYEYISQAIQGVSWTKLSISGDKAARATPLEPIFAAKKHVHVMRGSWNDPWINELAAFDGSGKMHDDQVDNLSAGYHWLIKGTIHVPDRNIRAKIRA